MCGIVGYIGDRNAEEILIKGLKRLEYRGYDSAGIAILNNDQIRPFKKKGKVSELENFIENQDTTGSIGIAHTRWATHGEPNDINAHPHCDENCNFAVVHNGIIENYAELRDELKAKGHIFVSQTDTEVLVHMIEECYKDSGIFERAVKETLKRVEGTYGLLVISKMHPDLVIASRKGSPLVVGIGDGEYFIASDAVPIVEYTKSVVYLNDYDLAIIKRDKFVLKTLEDEIKEAEVKILELEAEELEKSGYDHFMLKEIFDQPRALQESTRGRVRPDIPEIKLGGLEAVADKIVNAKRIILVSCGTSWHTCLIAEHAIESIAGVPCEVDYASEFRYREPIISSGDVVMAISQSGETADTLEALRLAKSKGALTLGIVNVIGSTISRETDAGIYMHCGPEIGVASTKAFTTPVTIMIMFALWLAKQKGNYSPELYAELTKEIALLPEKIEEALQESDNIRIVANEIKDATSAIFLGRGINFPIALEGALKLKECSYIHAEGYPSGEMKHGPIALIDENMPVIFFVPDDRYYEKNISNLQEVKARKGKIIAITNKKNANLEASSDWVIRIPEIHPLLAPIVGTIPMQLLAYHVAIMKGCNVDQPRNLAKSVTVE
jgi:glutamine---fructose-6-phosphate transaminase (isomerizing)